MCANVFINYNKEKKFIRKMSTNSKVLQLLRNAELSPDKGAAINALNSKLNELKDGQILINRYGD